MPQDWIDGVLISVFKGKYSKSTIVPELSLFWYQLVRSSQSFNWIGYWITFVQYLLQKNSHFRPDWKTKDIIFTITQERLIKQWISQYNVFVDMIKAFGTGDTLWRILGEIGCAIIFINLAWQEGLFYI